ncbi:hypothetical protein ACQY1Q_07660 [Tenacibaculum sp. TC6]|uniref:hypothetical protein n=1 Tax=Tenacibaculum sp. TC6 TaxID=3423223 RepID=UPI003D36F2CD
MKKVIFIIYCFFASSIILAQQKKRDTLFIKYDNSLLTKKQLRGEKTYIYVIKGTGNQKDFVYLLEEGMCFNLKPKNVKKFKTILKKSNAYYKKDKLYDWKLAEYLGKYVVFLVKGNKYIKVVVVEGIE